MALFIFKYLLIPYIIVLVLAMRGSLRAQFILFSFFVFLLYYSFANIMGVIYDRITGLSLINALYLNGSIFSLILICLNHGFRSMDFKAIKRRFTPKIPRMQTAVLFLFASLFLACNFICRLMRWLSDHELTCLLCVISKGIVFILILMPIYIITAVLLFKKSPLGYILAPIFLPICAISATEFGGLLTGDSDFFLFLLGSIILEIIFLKNMKKDYKKTKNQEK